MSRHWIDWTEFINGKTQIIRWSGRNNTFFQNDFAQNAENVVFFAQVHSARKKYNVTIDTR